LICGSFPDSSHVRLLGLGGADDLTLWERARSEGEFLVTKDEDFLRLSMSRGFPPKVICLAIGRRQWGHSCPAAGSRCRDRGFLHPSGGRFSAAQPRGQALRCCAVLWQAEAWRQELNSFAAWGLPSTKATRVSGSCSSDRGDSLVAGAADPGGVAARQLLGMNVALAV
jgi:hypothetical protein